MKKFKKFIACASLVALSVSAVACSNAEGSQEETKVESTQKETKDPKVVIAKVGEAEILQEQLTQEMLYIEQLLTMQYGEDFMSNADAKAVYDAQKDQIVNYLIETQLVLQDAKGLGIEVTDEQVDEEVKIGKEQLGSEEAYKSFLEQQGMTEEELRAYLKENLIIGQVLEQVTKDVAVTDEEVSKYYEDNKAEFTVGAGADMSHILVPTEEEAKNIKKEYEAGKTFEELAAQYGTDGTKETGGSLGFIEYDSTMYDKDFLAGAKDLGEGEVSEPVKTQFGYHLIKTDNLKQETVTPFEEVKESLKEKLAQEQQYKVFNDYIQGLKDKATIETFEY